MVTVLYRAEGEPEIKGTTAFEDVDTGAYNGNRAELKMFRTVNSFIYNSDTFFYTNCLSNIH